MAVDPAAALYDETAARASGVVLSKYSTSFGLGTKLLGARARRGIEAVYALVRIADEIVDTRRGADAGPLLDELEAQTARALESGYSTNLVVHAFARTAHQVGIGHREIDPFFASMRMDLSVLVHDRGSYQRYVYGSAEVIGLMCLAVFLDAARKPGDPIPVPDARLRAGAQALGAAFQKINFLRDLGVDYGQLGRSYFPGVTPDTLDQATLDEIVAEIAADIAMARASLPGLPRRARWAVAATLGLYDRLTTELAATPPAELVSRRVRVPGPTKLAIVARSVGGEIADEVRGNAVLARPQRATDLADTGSAAADAATAAAATDGRRVVVIGGGIGGLATAALLARGGAQVTLLERHETLGGRFGTLEIDGFRFDTGPSWYFMPEVFAHFFALFGEDVSGHLDLVRLDPAYRVFFEPAPGQVAETLDVGIDAAANWARFDALEPGAGERIRAYAASSTEAYRMAVDHFLYTTFARPDKVLGADIAGRTPQLLRLLSETLADRVARTVQDPRLRQVLSYHAVFLGSSPYRVPGLYTLMSHLDLVDGVRFPRGGMYTIIQAIERLAVAAGVEIRTGCDVVSIEVEAARRTARAPRRTGVATGVRLSTGEVVGADLVVSGADLHHTETVLLAPEHRALPEKSWQHRGPGISSLLIMLGVRGELPELPHHSLFFTRDWPGNFEALLGRGATSGTEDLRVPQDGSIYVSRTSATDPDASPPGHENVFILVPFPADPALGEGDAGRAALEEHADRFIDQVGTWAGIPGLRDRVVTRRVYGPSDFVADFSAWRGTALGMEHTLRQSALFRPANVSRRVPNLFYVGGGTIPGVGLPMCLISAELVAKRLLGETSSRALPTPLRPGFLDASRAPGAWPAAGLDRAP